MKMRKSSQRERGDFKEFIETMEMYLFVSDPAKESGLHQTIVEKIPAIDKILADNGLSFRLKIEEEGELDLIEIFTNPPRGFVHTQLKKQIIENLHELYDQLKASEKS
jgi:hypothetical protein